MLVAQARHVPIIAQMVEKLVTQEHTVVIRQQVELLHTLVHKEAS
jgi:hypothetical protein